MTLERIGELVRATLIILTLAAVTYMALVQSVPEARGGLIAALAAGMGWWYRGRVESANGTNGGGRDH